jgi:hypothetical protein
VIQAQLRHANISVTLDIYGHLFPSLVDEIAAKLETVFQERSRTRPRDVRALRPVHVARGGLPT